MRTFLIVLASASLVACQPRSNDAAPSGSDSSALSDTAGPGAAKGALTGREWVLVQLGDNTSPAGNGGKPVTLTFDTTESRAWGNAGCNRYSGPFTLSGSRLTFGPAISTKMACNEGMEVETAFLGMLPGVTGYQVTDSSLALTGASGTLARFQ